MNWKSGLDPYKLEIRPGTNRPTKAAINYPMRRQVLFSDFSILFLLSNLASKFRAPRAVASQPWLLHCATSPATPPLPAPSPSFSRASSAQETFRTPLSFPPLPSLSRRRIWDRTPWGISPDLIFRSSIRYTFCWKLFQFVLVSLLYFGFFLNPVQHELKSSTVT